MNENEQRRKENLERKIENQIQRIAEIEAKIKKLKSTENQLLKDLAKNKKLLTEGPERPKQTKVEVSQELKQEILQKSSAFSN